MPGLLERRLNLFSVITISISSMIGSGIFVLPGIGFEITGPSLYLAFLLAAICILPAAISKAELATAMPTSGGTYVYLERTFGPLAGTVSGLGLFLSILLKATFSLVGIKAYFSVLSSFDPTYTSLSFLAVIVLLNIYGVGKVSTFLTVILFITLASLGILSLFVLPQIDLGNFSNQFPHGFEGLAAATGLVFVSFAGVTKIAAIAEEIKNPEKNLPRGIIFSLILVTIIYCLISFLLAGFYQYQDIAGELKPIYRLAFDIGGPVIGAMFAVVATLTMVNTANAGILAGSRFPFAMARDQLLPAFLGKLHKKFFTPIASIILSGLIILVILFSFDVTKIAKLASAFMILIYILESLSVIVLRESRAQWYKPEYKSPFYPWLQLFGIFTCSALLIAMGKIALYAIVSITIPGVLLYIFYSRKKTTRRGVFANRGRRLDLTHQPEEVVEEEVKIPTPRYFPFFNQEADAEVVVSLFGRERSPEMLVEMGLSLADHKNIEVVHIIEIPEQTNLDDISAEPPQMQSLRRRVLGMAQDRNESISYDPVTSHDVAKTVYEISQRLHCNWLVLEWSGKKGGVTFHSPIGWLKSHLHCNLATYRDAGVRYIRCIMVLIHTDKNDALVLSTADHLAEVYNAKITLVRFSKNSDSSEKKLFDQRFLEELASNQKIKPEVKVLHGDDEITSILNKTAKFDLFLLGSSDSNFINSLRGTYDDKLIARASCSVLAVHTASNI